MDNNEFGSETGNISVPDAMKQARYTPKVRQEKTYKSEWEFLSEKIDEALQLLSSNFLLKGFKKVITNKIEEDFDNKFVDFILVILLEDTNDVSSLIKEIAYFRERSISEDERDMFVSILFSELQFKKDALMKEFLSLLNCNQQKRVKEMVKSEGLQQTTKQVDTKDEIDVDSIEEKLTERKKKNRKKSHMKQVYLVSKKTNEKPRRRKKTDISTEQKIISVLEKQKSFLIYKEAFPLPNGIKRIRIKESFDEVVGFIEKYVKNHDEINPKIIIEDEKAKVVFEHSKEIKKERNVRRLKMYA